MKGGGKIDLTWSVCQTHTSVHVAHQFIVYYTSIMPSYSLHIRTLHRLRPPPYAIVSPCSHKCLGGLYICMYVRTYVRKYVCT